MSILYIRLPSSAAADRAAELHELPCPYALVVQEKAIAQQGIAPLSGLAEQIAKAQRVVVLLAASDVTLLRIRIPPLSPAKLKLALPNLVEEHIITDPSECVIVAGHPSDGIHSIAVVQHNWLKQIKDMLYGYGARRVTALPSQLCLPFQPDRPNEVHAAINEHESGIDLALRLSEHEAIGLAGSIDPGESPLHAAIRAIDAIIPSSQITLYAPQSTMASYQNQIKESGNTRFNVSTDNWSRWITGAAATTLDLLADQRGKQRIRLDWQVWRWPFALAGMLLLTNIIALNFDWLQMKREADALRAAMFQTYRAAFPNETVIIDPLAQTQQKIAIARRSSGLAAEDDFTSIIAAFGEAWSNTAAVPGNGAANIPTIASIGYRDRGVVIRLKPGAEAPTRQMQSALAVYNLSLELAPSQSAGTVWEIRSTR